jgi:hypothetical protein
LGDLHSCSTTREELVYGIEVDKATYCYEEVTNTGTIKLCKVAITDPLMGGEYSKGIDGSSAQMEKMLSSLP